MGLNPSLCYKDKGNFLVLVTAAVCLIAAHIFTGRGYATRAKVGINWYSGSNRAECSCCSGAYCRRPAL